MVLKMRKVILSVVKRSLTLTKLYQDFMSPKPLQYAKGSFFVDSILHKLTYR